MGYLISFSMFCTHVRLSCFPSGGPVSEPGAPHPGAGSSEAPRGGEQRDSEDRWQVSETFKTVNIFNICLSDH